MYGAVPPTATREERYGTPTCPALDAQVSESVTDAATIVMPQLLIAVAPNESVTLDVSLNAPGVVGVPLMPPVDGLRIRPGGRPPAAIK